MGVGPWLHRNFLSVSKGRAAVVAEMKWILTSHSAADSASRNGPVGWSCRSDSLMPPPMGPFLSLFHFSYSYRFRRVPMESIEIVSRFLRNFTTTGKERKRKRNGLGGAVFIVGLKRFMIQNFSIRFRLDCYLDHIHLQLSSSISPFTQDSNDNMFNVVKLLEKARPRIALASPSSSTILPKFSGIRFRRASDGPNDDRQLTQNLDEKGSEKKAPTESSEAWDDLTEEYVTRCDDDGYGGIIYGKDMHIASEDEEENIADDNRPANSSGSSDQSKKRRTN